MFTSITHTSPSLTASLAIIVPTRSSFFEISKSQKSEHVLRSVLSRPHYNTSLCLTTSRARFPTSRFKGCYLANSATYRTQQGLQPQSSNVHAIAVPVRRDKEIYLVPCLSVSYGHIPWTLSLRSPSCLLPDLPPYAITIPDPATLPPYRVALSRPPMSPVRDHCPSLGTRTYMCSNCAGSCCLNLTDINVCLKVLRVVAAAASPQMPRRSCGSCCAG